jgi:type IV secretion system protein VirB4
VAFSIRKPPAVQLLSRHIPWVDHISDHVIRFDDGSLFAMFEAEGIPFDTVEPDETNATHARLNLTLQNIADEGLIVYRWNCRGLADPSLYPAGAFRSSFAERLDARYRERLFDKHLYLNRLLLGLQIRPARYAGEWFGEQVAKRSRAKREDDPPTDRAEQLERVCGLLMEELAPYRPRRLGVVSRGRQLFSEIAEAVVFAMTGVWRPIGMTTGRLSSMFSEDILIGSETIEIRGPAASIYAIMLRVREYPSETWPGMLDVFLRCSYRCTIFQWFRPLNKPAALDLVNRKQNKMTNAGDKAVSQQEELIGAADKVAGNQMLIGAHSIALCAFAGRADGVTEVANAAWRDLADCGAVVARDNLALEAAYLSMIPGNRRFAPAPGAISSRNFCAMAPLHAYPSGRKAKPFWRDPIALLRTVGGTPYELHLHVGDVGNVFISGEVGSGKSVLIAFVLAQVEKLGVQSVVWDKDRGLEPAVRFLGGSYLPLSLPTGISLLKGLENTPDDLAFQARLIRGLISSPEPYEMAPEEDRRLHVGLRAVMSLPRKQRWLGELVAFLGTNPKGAGARLKKWCWGAEYGGVVDCPEDLIRLDAPVIGFDQTHILDNPMARGPVMATLFHRVEKLIDGRRLLFVIDEFWKSLLDPAFRDAVNDKLKTLRKRNSPVIMATQSPSDALKSPIRHTILQQCPTQIYFANGRSSWEELGEPGMGLTHPEVEIVKALPKATGTFLLKQGKHSTVAQLMLSGMDDELAVLSGREETVRILDQVRADAAEDLAGVEQAFHERRKELA